MNILLALLPTLIGILSKFVGPQWGNLASISLSAVEAIIAELKNGGGSLTATITGILEQLVNEAQAVQKVGGLSSEQEAVLMESIALVIAGLQGVSQAEAGADPAQLPVPPPVE